MKKKKSKPVKKRPSGRSTTRHRTPAASRKPAHPVAPRAGKDAPDTSVTAEFKAGKDL